MIRIAGISSAQGEVNERVTPLPTATAESPSQPVTDPNHQASPKPFYKRFLTTQAFFAAVAGATVEQLEDWPGQWGRTGTSFEKRAASLYSPVVVGASDRWMGSK